MDGLLSSGIDGFSFGEVELGDLCGGDGYFILYVSGEEGGPIERMT